MAIFHHSKPECLVPVRDLASEGASTSELPAQEGKVASERLFWTVDTDLIIRNAQPTIVAALGEECLQESLKIRILRSGSKLQASLQRYPERGFKHEVMLTNAEKGGAVNA